MLCQAKTSLCPVAVPGWKRRGLGHSSWRFLTKMSWARLWKPITYCLESLEACVIDGGVLRFWLWLLVVGRPKAVLVLSGERARDT